MKLKSTPPIFCPNPKEPLAFSPYEAQLTGQQWVPDIGLANWLLDVYPGSKLISHNTPIECQAVLGNAVKAMGRPRKIATLTPAERVARNYEKQKIMTLTKSTLYKALFVRNDIALSHETSVHSRDIEQSVHLDWDDIRIQLRQCLDQIQAKKEDNTLISGALFDPSLAKDTTKGLDNIVAVNGVWLDFDNGLLMPDEFARIFPDVKWLLFNSFNNGKDGKTKFRVLFPSRSPLTADMYHAIWDAVAERIKEFGYFVGTDKSYDEALKSGRSMPPKSGLDVSKRTANSFFYLPCRAGLGLKYTFWRENWLDNVPIMDPDLWISYAPIEPQQYVLKPAYDNNVVYAKPDIDNQNNNQVNNRSANFNKNETAILTAISEWRSLPAGMGNNGFYRLACKLKTAGLNDFEIRQILEQEAAYGHSPAERRGQIKGIMSSLRKFNPSKMAA